MFVTGKMRAPGRIRGRISRRGGNVGGLRQVRLHLAPAESRATIKFVERDFSPPHQLIHPASRPAQTGGYLGFADVRLRRRFRHGERSDRHHRHGRFRVHTLTARNWMLDRFHIGSSPPKWQSARTLQAGDRLRVALPPPKKTKPTIQAVTWMVGTKRSQMIFF